MDFAKPLCSLLLLHCQIKLNSILNILHSFSEAGIVHQLEKVLFKIIFSLFPFFSVQVYVFLQPSLLLEAYDVVNLLYFKPQPNNIFQIPIMNAILHFIHEVWHQLCGLIVEFNIVFDCHLLLIL